MDKEYLIRNTAFTWLKRYVDIHGDVLTRDILLNGFTYKGERVTLLGAKGIWKPRQMQLPLSITTIPGRPYEDAYDNQTGLLSYKYRGTDPNHPDNTGLRELMKNNIPLIYFHRLVKGKYLATWPVYITGEMQDHLNFIVAVDDVLHLQVQKDKQELSEPEENYARRSYITRHFRQRIHQRSFRERVLSAYSEKCAICRLKHRELLDAAHIIPDTEERGFPVVSNGISLCKIHHAAFDSNIIGIDPDYKVSVRKDILEEHDGPMLRYGLQELNKHKLTLPKEKKDWPNRDWLDERFQRFLRS